MTIGLYLIVKDEVESVDNLIREAYPHFDGIYITASDKKAANQLIKSLAKLEKVNIDYRPWTGRFDEARNHNFGQGDTDLKFWLDADDTFDFDKYMPAIKKTAEQYDVIWLPYNYERDENGNVVVMHWRERVIPSNKGFIWKGWVHENCITDEQVTTTRLPFPVEHNITHKAESQQRNHEILKEAYAATEDPRYIHYLGLSYYTQHLWQEAIDIFREYISVGGWDEEIYRSLIKMSEAAAQLGKFDEGHEYALRAAGLLPEYPQAYFQLADLCFKQDQWKPCLEWLKVAFAKPQPETAAITDPTVPDKARLMGAVCEFKLGNARHASELIKGVETVDTGDLPGIFEYEASVERLAGALPALKKHYQEPKLLWENLHEEIKYDNRFRKFREAVTEPKEWPEKSIIFFCGKGYEEWGPHTLDKGMGGAEEAIVYLSRELSKYARVTVFGAVSKVMYDPGGAIWLPWTHIDKRDTFDTLIIWRYPQFVPQFKAKRKFVDMHDLLPAKMVKSYKDAVYLFKSEWHAKQYPHIVNYNVIGNGIVLNQFKGGNDAVQKPSSKKVDARQQTKDGRQVGKRNQEEKVTKKSKEE